MPFGKPVAEVPEQNRVVKLRRMNLQPWPTPGSAIEPGKLLLCSAFYISHWLSQRPSAQAPYLLRPPSPNLHPRQPPLEPAAVAGRNAARRAREA
jgi:hypothetical protein